VFREKSTLTFRERTTERERDEPECPTHESLLPSVEVGKSTQEKEQASLTNGELA